MPKKPRIVPPPPSEPAALVDFMMRSWRRPKPPSSRPLSNLDELRGRRARLSRRYRGQAVVIPTGREKFRVADTTFRFRAGSDFFYLTGNPEPDCVLVLLPKGERGHEKVLFVEPNPGRSDRTFFTDRHKGELWVGPRLGLEESRRRYGVDRTAALASLTKVLRELRRRRKKAHVLRGLAAEVDAALGRETDGDRELGIFLGEQRLKKSPSEVRSLVRAVHATQRGFDDVIRALPSAKTERDVEGVFNARARAEGNDVGYGTIAAAGAHACILHWTRNDGPLRARDLLLVDAGIEGHDLYTADVTRTLPIGGRFSPAQRLVYDLVIEALLVATRAVRPGADFLAPHRAASHVLAHGLERLGILPMSADVALRDENQFYKRYSLHGTSHMLGLDVHDCDRARPEHYRYGKLAPGMVLTVEPGLYFQMDDLTVPQRFRGIGIRVEDDVLVTARGRRVLTRDIPRTAVDVEAWMQGLWTRRAS